MHEGACWWLILAIVNAILVTINLKIIITSYIREKPCSFNIATKFLIILTAVVATYLFSISLTEYVRIAVTVPK